MKLDEVASAGKKFALVLFAHDRSIDADDWQGTTKVYFSRKEFETDIAKEFAEFADLAEDGVSYKAAQDHPMWDDFVEAVWIDDRF